MTVKAAAFPSSRAAETALGTESKSLRLRGERSDSLDEKINGRKA